MEKILFIDTSNNKEITVSLKLDGKEIVETRPSEHHKAQVVLPMINEILKEHQLKPLDLTGIEVNDGPGSFTGLRVGVAIANTLAAVLQIPINGKKVGEYVEPVYS
jgi:tRNA threonylcarbamoyladenosine biosynthesis protein TsaB